MHDRISTGKQPIPQPRPRVLVADADADSRTLYRLLLDLAGFDVLEASDGRDALTRALVDPPVLILTETALPLVDGYALCEILRRDPVTRAIPILAVTAEARVNRRYRMRAVGADAVLVKPAAPDDILSEVRRLVGEPGEVRPRSVATPDTAGELPVRSADEDAAQNTHTRSRSKTHARFTTTTPPMTPAALRCPVCDRPLDYDHSHLGGVSARYPEQWDYYTCPTCGAFQYRQRTRKLRSVDALTASVRDS